jgi:hypothetical protein
VDFTLTYEPRDRRRIRVGSQPCPSRPTPVGVTTPSHPSVDTATPLRPTSRFLPAQFDKPMLDKIADELVELRRRAQRNRIGPIVQGREQSEGGRKQLEYLWMLGVRRHGDYERGIAPDRVGITRTTFENRTNIVSAMEEYDVGVAADAVSPRHARHRLRHPGSGTDTRLRNCKFASRDITQIRRFRGHAAPASAKKIVELPRVFEASDVDRWIRFDKFTHDRGVIGPQELDCPGKYATDLLHTLLMREACLKAKQSLIDPLQGGIGRFAPVGAKIRGG